MQDIQPDTDFDIKIPIDGEQGVYTAQLMSNSTKWHYWALARAIVIE